MGSVELTHDAAAVLRDPWLSRHLVCPRDHSGLAADGSDLVCARAHRYPVVDGIPVMVLGDVEQTHWVASHSLAHPGDRYPEPAAGAIHPFVQDAIGATCGNLYRRLIHNVSEYPIPDLRCLDGGAGSFLEIGCNWGRWCVSAARLGFHAVGIDPHLNAIRAARIVAAQTGVDATFVVADGRYLPFKTGSFSVVFSYSVLQHFSRADVRRTLGEARRVLAEGGEAVVQMPNAIGARNLYQQAKRRFRDGVEFQVRYWHLRELIATFERGVGPSTLAVDGFFSLNAQPVDLPLLPWPSRIIVRASELLRRATRYAPGLIRVADSVYVHAIKTGP